MTTFTASVLIGERSAKGNVATPTKIANVPIAATLELQSTVGAFVPPRMNAAQINALTHVDRGSLAWNSTTNELFAYSGTWDPFTLTTTYMEKPSLNDVEIVGMHANSVQLTNAVLSLREMIVVEQVVITKLYDGANFTDGGNIRIQYGNTPGAGGGGISAIFGNGTYTLPAEILTAQPNDIIYIAGSGVDGLAGSVSNAVDIIQKQIYITNDVQQFNNPGAGGTGLSINILYRVVTFPNP